MMSGFNNFYIPISSKNKRGSIMKNIIKLIFVTASKLFLRSLEVYLSPNWYLYAIGKVFYHLTLQLISIHNFRNNNSKNSNEFFRHMTEILKKIGSLEESRENIIRKQRFHYIIDHSVDLFLSDYIYRIYKQNYI